MKSRLTDDFIACFRRLPKQGQSLARKNYRLWRDDPWHRSLRFKRVNEAEPVYSVRVDIHHRAIGLLEDQTITWFWIGTHDEYEKIIGCVTMSPLASTSI